MIGHSAIDFIHPDDLENTRSEMRAARRGQTKRSFEARYYHYDGHEVTLNWMGTWSEPVKRHFFIGRDLTEKQAAEAQFRQVAEDGLDRPADRRRRPRFQQRAHRHHRHDRHPGGRGRRPARARRHHQADRRCRRARRATDQASARLRPQAAASAARDRRQCADARGGQAAAPDTRRADLHHAAAHRGCLAGAGRSGPALHRDPQSRAERARRHARRRHAGAGDPQHLPRRRLCQHESRRRRRQLRDDRGERHRLGHSART